MALAISTVPILTEDAAENFVNQSNYNSKHLAGSEYRAQKEAWCLSIIKNSRIDQEKRKNAK